MKKTNTWLVSFVLPVLIFTLVACQKNRDVISPNNSKQTITTESHGMLKGEPVNRAYRDSFDAWLNYVPDIAGGWVATNPFSKVWWPGGGDGNATHMGNASAYFNQYTLRVVTPNGPQIIMYHAPAIMFFGTELEPFNVPPEVSLVVFDDKGNSVWFRNDPAGLPTTRISPTRINFTGTMHIVGGTGKFTGATGETTINGYFNPLDLTECSIWQNGRIEY